MRALGSLEGASAARGPPRVVSTREGSTRGISKRGADAAPAGEAAGAELCARAGGPLSSSERITSSGVGRSAA
jgi:hypothetical protein